jgi:hypothetical protein
MEAGGVLMPGGQVRVDVHVDAEKASLAFKEARAQINTRVREGLEEAGRAVLPTAQLFAGNLKVRATPTRDLLTVKTTQRSAYLTSRVGGKIGRVVGLQEFGTRAEGGMRKEIRPRRGRRSTGSHAPAVGNVTFGFFAHTGPEYHYEGRHFLTRAVEVKRPVIEETLLNATLKAFKGFDAGGERL